VAEVEAQDMVHRPWGITRSRAGQPATGGSYAGRTAPAQCR
jgi:hypothetical protein